MPANRVILINATSCTPEVEEKWNKWYNETHIPMILKFKGVKKATRYKIVGDNPEGKYPTYLAIYEFDSQKDVQDYEASPEHAAAHKDFVESWKDKGHQRKWRVYYEVIKTWEK
ncbi:MAG: EthD family reductase [Chloroflexi bacterium]|nr:EthD family reductase [Chloroflexota bacterium]